jgi:hypothetical protein
MNAINNLTPQQLRQAANIQERILDLRHELDQLLGSTSEQAAGTPGGKRKLSAQGLANIRAGARKRWTKERAGNGAETAAPRRRRKMSAAGRASIAAKMKARWRAAKRAGRSAL